MVNDEIHYYTPDFLYKDKLIEIKGDHLYKNGHLIDTFGNIGAALLEAKEALIKQENI